MSKLPLFVAAVYSSLFTAALFLVLSVLGVALPAWMAVILFVSNAIQLVSLPLLGVAGKVQGDRIDNLIRETHDATKELLDDLHAKHDALQNHLKGLADDPSNA